MQLRAFNPTELDAHEVDDWMQHEQGWMFWSGYDKKGSLKRIGNVGMEVLLKREFEDAGDLTFV